MIPVSLTEIPRWILWKAEIREGKTTKVPCDLSGRRASVTDPKSWLSYDEASFQYEEEVRRAEGAAMFSGIGFCFSAEDELVGIDLDNCLPHLGGDARRILSVCQTYAERSPSGKGIKLIGRAIKPEGSKNRTSEITGATGIEVYDRDRFFTVTGEQFGFATEIEDIQDGLDWVCQQFLAPATPDRAPGVARSLVEGSSLLERAAGFEGDDATLIEFIRADPRYEALWTGDMSAYADDYSRARYALLEKIAFVAGPVPERIERIFDASALGDHEKWRSRPKLRESEIAGVLADKTDFYSGGSAATPLLDSSDHPELPETSGTRAAEEAVTPVADQPAQPSSAAPSSFPIPERGVIRDIVDMMGPMSSSPDSTLALSAVVMLSAVTGWRRWFEWMESREPCIVYACIVGPSAVARKTTGMRSIEQLFTDAGLELKVESGGHISGRGLVEVAMGGEIDVFYVKEPKITADEYLPGPIDGERVRNPEWVEQNESWTSWHDQRRKLLEEPPHVVLVWDEFGKMMNVEDDWQRDTRADLLAMYNGQHRGIRTSGKQGAKVPKGKVQMGMIATMTDDDLRRSLNSTQVTDGLMGRILFSPPGEPKRSLSRPPAKGLEYEQARAAIIAKLQAFEEAVRNPSDGWSGWTMEALTEWDAWFHDRESKCVGIEVLLFGRGQATAAKMAVLFALAEASDQVEVRHVRYACSVLESSLTVSMRAYEAHVEAQRDRYCDEVFLFVASQGDQPLSKVLERGMLGGKEPGERMPDREARTDWLVKDSRLAIEKGASGKGHVVRLATEDDA